MALFLSGEWLDALAKTLAASGPIGSPKRLALGQIVTGSPMGDVSYTLVIGGGEPTTVVVGTATASVVIVEDHATALAIATGRPAAELLASANVKIRGDVAALLDAQELLAAVGEALASATRSTEHE